MSSTTNLSSGQVPLTPRQQLLLDALRDAGAELSNQDLHHRLSQCHQSIGLATIYRQMRWLQQRGLVRSRLLPTGETLYAPVDHDAHHLTCVLCGSSVTLPVCPMHDQPLPTELRGGFLPLFHTLEYYGHCAACRSAVAEPEASPGLPGLRRHRQAAPPSRPAAHLAGQAAEGESPTNAQHPAHTHSDFA
jgi:Fur family ferric uptake transcriptional regulator